MDYESIRGRPSPSALWKLFVRLAAASVRSASSSSSPPPPMSVPPLLYSTSSRAGQQSNRQGCDPAKRGFIFVPCASTAPFRCLAQKMRGFSRVVLLLLPLLFILSSTSGLPTHFLQQQFSEWKSVYSVTYESPAEEQQRFAIWSANFHRVAEHNARADACISPLLTSLLSSSTSTPYYATTSSSNLSQRPPPLVRFRPLHLPHAHERLRSSISLRVPSHPPRTCAL